MRSGRGSMEFRKKFEGGVQDLRARPSRGRTGGVGGGTGGGSGAGAADAARLREIAKKIEAAEPKEVNEIARWGELEGLMAAWPDRSQTTEYQLTAAGAQAGYPRVMVDRERALYAAWYEFFPRSAEGRGDRGSTFRDCLNRIDDAKAMGFDVIYFPPIHPIGQTKRKGRNNSVVSEPGDPGVPYAIGNRHAGCPNGGGHKDIEPALGTFEDFDWLIDELEKRGMELALDFAINCSPDHPYVHDKPEWFFKRPDGTIKYAENPPKKYEDVYPLNFFCEDWRALWEEMTSIILFWAERRVRIFRVDNPHTKPVAFWEYLIAKVRAKYPGRDLPVGGVYAAEDDEGAGEGRVPAELHLLYVAQFQAGDHGVFHRTDADGDEGLLPGKSCFRIRRISCPIFCNRADGRHS